MISTPIVAELDATPASLYLCTALVVRQLGETALFIQSSGPDFKSAVVRQDFKLPLIIMDSHEFKLTDSVNNEYGAHMHLLIIVLAVIVVLVIAKKVL